MLKSNVREIVELPLYETEANLHGRGQGYSSHAIQSGSKSGNPALP